MAESEFDIIHHIADSHVIEIFNWHINLPHWEIAGIDMSPTKHVVMMWIASALMLAVFIAITRKEHLIPRGIRNFFETIAVFIQDFIAKPYLKNDANTYLPFLWTAFFFIMFCNLIGLIPFGATPTGNIFVTATLALISFTTIQVSAVLRHGPIGYFKAFVPHVPWWLWPMMFLVEIMGWFAKTVALAVRLFANMVGGHVVLMGFFSLIFIFQSYIVGGASVIACVVLSCLEIFVAVLQAFVFTFLSAVFLGMMLHPEH